MTAPTDQPKFKIGDKVILGEHRIKDSPRGEKDWNEDMDAFIGKTATIIDDPKYAPYVQMVVAHVDVDGGMWSWRLVSMTPADGSPTVSAVGSGAKCQRCGEYNEYAPSSPTFVCYGCKH